MSDLDAQFEKAKVLLSSSPILRKTSGPQEYSTLPIGVGFLLWGASLSHAIQSVKTHKPCAVWLFAPRTNEDLADWSQKVREASPETKIWVQVCSLKEAVETMEACEPDVLVLQGQDAGGHGKFDAASIITLIPEVVEELNEKPVGGKRKPALIAAGGISTAASALAALSLGAQGVVLGTRLLAAEEANIPRGHQLSLLHSSDGGQNTVRTKLYDTLRGITQWPVEYGGRGIKNQSWTDAEAGMTVDENKRLYQVLEAKGTGVSEGWGFGSDETGRVEQGRLTAYAGTGIGLVKEVLPTRVIVDEVRTGILKNWRELGTALLGPTV